MTTMLFVLVHQSIHCSYTVGFMTGMAIECSNYPQCFSFEGHGQTENNSGKKDHNGMRAD